MSITSTLSNRGETGAVARLVKKATGSMSALAMMGSVVAHAAVGALFLIQGPKVIDMGEPILAEIVFESEVPAPAASPSTPTDETNLGPAIEATPVPPLQMVNLNDFGDIDESADAFTARLADPAPIVESAPSPPSPALEDIEDLESGSHTLVAVVAEPAATEEFQSETDVELTFEQPEPPSQTVEIEPKFVLPPPKPPIPKKRVPEEPVRPETAVAHYSPPDRNSGLEEDDPSEEPPSVVSEIASPGAHSIDRHRQEFTEQATITTPRGATTDSGKGAAPASGNPRPRYPSRALAHGIQGRVVLSVEVTRSGTAGDVRVVGTSGHRILDVAAIRAIRRWQFLPAKRFGVPVDASVTIPVTFRLSE